MISCVLDATAVLAVIGDEPGADNVIAHSQGALISTVDLAEAYSETADKNVTANEISWAIHSLQLIPVPLCEQQAMLIGSFRKPTRQLGLSLGDRACLALGFHKRLPVLTAEGDWQKVQLGVEVRLFR